MRKGLRVAAATALAIASLVLGGAPAHAAGCGSTGLATRTIYLPNITKTLGGPSGWVTPFIVQNVGVAATDLEVSFYRFSDGALVTCRRIVALQPFRSFADYPNADTDLPGDAQFAVVVRSFGSDVIAVVNEHQGAGPTAEALSYVGLTSGAQALGLPYVAKLASGWIVRFVVQNLGAVTTNVTARFTSFDGSKTATLTRSIAPGASRFVDPLSEPSLLAGTEYSVMLSADQPIAAIANAHNDAPGAIAPMGFSYNAVPAAPAEQIYVPSIARNVEGRTTRLVIQNTGTAPATPLLQFRRGVATNSVVAPSIATGRSWSFDAQSLPEGDWSLTIGGGQFAALAITTSSTSALGFVGKTNPGNRAYLPNVTRTLGGPAGWTTPILLQSAGATSATLRWYRFADGVLITRQQVTGLTAGATVRIDPRGVPGLFDDTQYAVVVDAQGGNVAATVLELSFEGGDGAMAYEGFAASVSTTAAPTVIALTAARTVIYPGARDQLTAVVRDQFDQVMNVPVTWSLSTTALGSISAAGLLVTFPTASGAVVVTAAAGAASASIAITVMPRPTAVVGGITFGVDTTGLANVYAEQTITSSEASTFAAQVDLDVGAIQEHYGRSFAKRPTLYFLSNTTTFTTALQTVLGQDPTIAQQIGTVAAGVYDYAADAIAVNWSRVQDISPFTAARHELTHMMEAQVAGGGGLPAWFNEGNARYEEFTVAGTKWMYMFARYGAASMLRQGALIPLTDLTSLGVWNSRTGPAGTYQYHEASEAIRMLRDRVGTRGVLRMQELVGQGIRFADAFVAVTGEPLETFAASFPTRVAATAASYPGIATADDTPAGPGLSIMLYGLPPGVSVTVSVIGAAGAGGASTPRTFTASAFGTTLAYLDDAWPAGPYTISASWSGGSLTANATKAAVNPLAPAVVISSGQ